MHIIDGTVGECWTEDERVPELQTQSKITRKFQLKRESKKKSCFQPLALTPFAVNYKGGVGIIDVPLPVCGGIVHDMMDATHTVMMSIPPISSPFT